jgi:hypothetical protein
MVDNPDSVPEYVGFGGAYLQPENNFLSLSADLW